PPRNLHSFPTRRSSDLDEDTAFAITLTGSDVESDALTFRIVTPPAHGTLSGAGANQTYRPQTNFFGTDTFTFKANDGQADSTEATLTITRNTANDQPTV